MRAIGWLLSTRELVLTQDTSEQKTILPNRTLCVKSETSLLSHTKAAVQSGITRRPLKLQQ